MAGTIPAMTEVTRGSNDTSPEQPVPDSIDENARGQWMLGDCFRQFSPTASIGKCGWLPVRQNLKEPPWSVLTKSIGVTPHIYFGVGGLRRFSQPHKVRKRGRN